MLASSLSLVILRGALGLRRNHWVLQLFSQGQSIMFALLLVACASWSVLLPSLPKGILGSTGKQCDGARVVATHRSVMVTHCSQPRFFWVPPPKFIFADEFELNFFFRGIKFKWSSFFSKHWPKHTVSFELKMVKKHQWDQKLVLFLLLRFCLDKIIGIVFQKIWLAGQTSQSTESSQKHRLLKQTIFLRGIINLLYTQYRSKVSWQKKWFLIGRYKSQTGSTRTTSPGRINSDRLGPTRIG